MIRSRNLALAVCAVALGASVTTANASGFRAQSDDTVPPPVDKIKIQLKSLNGSGCKAGTTAVAMSPDNEALTITFSDYIAETGPGISRRAFRKNCQIAMNLLVPSGFSYGVVKADYRGFGAIAEGASGEQKASYYFQGQSSTQRSASPLTGPVETDYTFTDETDIASVVWSPCGETRYFNANTELKVNRGTSTEYSMMTLDAADVSVATKFHFAWKKCPTQ